jgi:hypothetical protein
MTGSINEYVKFENVFAEVFFAIMSTFVFLGLLAKITSIPSQTK